MHAVTLTETDRIARRINRRRARTLWDSGRRIAVTDGIPSMAPYGDIRPSDAEAYPGEHGFDAYANSAAYYAVGAAVWWEIVARVSDAERAELMALVAPKADPVPLSTVTLYRLFDTVSGREMAGEWETAAEARRFAESAGVWGRFHVAEVEVFANPRFAELTEGQGN